MFAANPTPKLISNSQSRQALEELYRGKNLYAYRSGQSIPMNHQDLYVVCRGVVQLSMLYPSGDEVLLGLVAPTMPFGLSLTAVESYHAIALSDVNLMRLSLAEIEQSPQFIQNIWLQMGRRLRQTEAMLALVGHRRVKDRLCSLLLLLKQEMGQPVNEGTKLTVKLTHQSLANAIGTTRVTVTRLIGQLREEGWLTIDPQRYMIIHV